MPVGKSDKPRRDGIPHLSMSLRAISNCRSRAFQNCEAIERSHRCVPPTFGVGHTLVDVHVDIRRHGIMKMTRVPRYDRPKQPPELEVCLML